MGDWDIDSPVKGGSSGGPPPVAGQPAAGPALPNDPPSLAGQAPVSGRAAPPAPTPNASAPGKGRARRSYGWLGIAVVMLLVGLMAGFYIARSQTSGDEAALADAIARLGELEAAASQVEDRNWTYYRANEGLKEELSRATSSAPTTAPAANTEGTYGPGLYLVGEDIPPGTYDGVVDGSIGYWARLKGTEGAIASIIENGIPKGPFVLTIESADRAVELRGVTLTQR